MCAQASVSARAPALEAAGKPSAARAQDRDGPADGDGVAASAVSVAALLSELSAARADAARYEAEARRASAGSRAEASEERRRRIAAEAAAEEARAEAAAAASALAGARAAEKKARDEADARGAAASALEADLRAAKAELADARRASRRADTAATNLAARVADLERQRVHGSKAGKVAKPPRAAPAAAPERDLESRLASMQSEFEELRARLRARDPEQDEDDEPVRFPTSVRRPLSPLRAALGAKRRRDDASDSDASASDSGDETLAAVASRARGKKASAPASRALRPKATPKRQATRDAKGGRGRGPPGRGSDAVDPQTRFAGTLESVTSSLRASHLSDARAPFPFVEAWRAEGFGAADAVARALCVACLDIAASPDAPENSQNSQTEARAFRSGDAADAAAPEPDPGWRALARPWWEGESRGTRFAAYPRWVGAVLAADEAAVRGDVEPRVADRVATHLDAAVAAACAGADARDSLRSGADAGSAIRAPDGSFPETVSGPTAVRLAAAAAACATALRRARPGTASEDSGAPIAALGGAAATRRMVLEAFAFGLPAPAHAPEGGEAPASFAAAAALAAAASAASVWRGALDTSKESPPSSDGSPSSVYYDGHSSLERLEVTFTKRVVRFVARLEEGDCPRAPAGAPAAESAELARLWRRGTEAIRGIFRETRGGEELGEVDPGPGARAVSLGDAVLELWRDRRHEAGLSAPPAPPRARGAAVGSEVRFVPRARGAEAAAAIADAMVWRRDRDQRSLAVQTALDAIEAAKDALRDAPTGAGSGAKRVSGKAAAAEAQALARASRLAAGLALVGPSFAESKNEHAFRLCRDALVEALAGLVVLAAAELSPTNLAAAAAGAAGASSLRALAGGGGAAEDALGAWTAATDGVRTRADAEASAAPNARRARAWGGGRTARSGTAPYRRARSSRRCDAVVRRRAARDVLNSYRYENRLPSRS